MRGAALDRIDGGGTERDREGGIHLGAAGGGEAVRGVAGVGACVGSCGLAVGVVVVSSGEVV